jgi:type III pantothenate kinase
MALLLAIDVGNTQITLGAFQDKALAQTWRLRTERHATADELGIQLRGLLHSAGIENSDLEGVIVASVVPPLDAALTEALQRYLRKEPLIVGPAIKLGIRNLYKNPSEVGADRLVNAAAVHSLVGGPAIVVDFGTATTFDCISKKGEYLGGVIAPGLEIANEALAARTAKLPRITFQVPSHVLGKTTIESLQSGLFWGYIALVEGVIQRLAQEMGGSPKVIATGGLSPVIGPRIRNKARVMPTLTLEGLRLLWERNT